MAVQSPSKDEKLGLIHEKNQKNPTQIQSQALMNSQNFTARCSECHKQFSSLKALFGHMRCHPDRNWRGIQPPNLAIRGNSTISGSSFEVSDQNQQEKQEIDENSQVFSWSVTAKRGKRENRGSETDEEWDTAVFLLRLADGGRGNFPARFSGDSEGESKKKRRYSSGVAEKFRCNTCRKVFDSHQALGGHRASHRKVKGCFACGNEEEKGESEFESAINIAESSNSIEEIQSVTPPRSGMRRLITRVVATPEPEKFPGGNHECSICHKVFPTGQALGGHKRCHWTGDRIGEKVKDRGNGAGRIPAELPVVLDLNEPAPLGEDDLEAAYSMIDVVPASIKALKHLGFNQDSIFR